MASSTIIFPPQNSEAQARSTIFPPQKPKAASQAPSLPHFSNVNKAMNSSQQPTSIPIPVSAPAPPKTSSSPSTNQPQHTTGSHTSYRRLSDAEWVQFCHGIGVLKDDESKEVIRPTSVVWPPKGFKDGLFQDVLFEKSKFTYWFHMLSTVRWVMMLLQLALSAVLTALGSVSRKDGTAITVIAAINTGVAGVLAMLHNSGLPDRYRSDRNEYYKIEEHMKEIIDTGLVPQDQSTNDVIAGCFDMFQAAKQTVQSNVPASYTPSANVTNTTMKTTILKK
ncbi:Uu.00g010270.m01.CDS01 [Anthostomella pinea]|uniref:Uu.00g010270.m01.CDS01 n=1 Tax=Anthostomella pinea TaxID=933095 RepID=A0AAI8VXJ3_9PEZI|nr:Uu.00g010270.m01.CDS01 [Anthostomella pinea]